MNAIGKVIDGKFEEFANNDRNYNVFRIRVLNKFGLIAVTLKRR